MNRLSNNKAQKNKATYKTQPFFQKDRKETVREERDVEFINLYTKGDIQRKHLSKRYCCHNWATTSNIAAAPESSPINRQSRNNGCCPPIPCPPLAGKERGEGRRAKKNRSAAFPAGSGSREYLAGESPVDMSAYRGTVEGPGLGNLSL
ncbi:hypothetical protein CDAR_195171 [Caerostris darwini]|uniref:Uncharacterized protein n=1 Tax=Caerostris darwini TaxID=1538125 RepID=A0AAV4X6K6_9ARAC|nr:hypothetical protein CDAR_195171 [Caerostris darwini]